MDNDKQNPIPKHSPAPSGTLGKVDAAPQAREGMPVDPLKNQPKPGAPQVVAHMGDLKK